MDGASAAQAAQTVAIPLAWFLGAIGTLGGVIAVLARTILKIQEDRRVEGLASQEKVLSALNNSTDALEKLTDAISRKAGA